MSVKEVSKPNRNRSQDFHDKQSSPNKSMESNKRFRMRECESKAKEEQKLPQDSSPKKSKKTLNISNSGESPNPKDFIKKNMDKVKKSKIEIDLNEAKMNELILELDGMDLTESCKPLDKTEAYRGIHNEMENCRSFGNMNNLNALKAMEDIQQHKELRNSSVNSLRNDKEHVSLNELLSPSKPALGKRLIERAKESMEYPGKSKGKNNRFSADSTEIILGKSPPKQSSSRSNDGRNPLELTLSLRSQQVLTNKFIKEFNECIEASDLTSDNLNLNSVIAVLQQLNFIKNDPSSNKFEEETTLVLKLWRLSKCDNFIARSHLLEICLRIMNLPLPEGTEKYNHTAEEAVQIHKILFPLYQNKQLMVTRKRKKEEKQEALEECSFKPKINEDSKYLAAEKQRRFGSVGSQLRDEYFEWKNSRIEEKRKQLKQEKEDMEIEECTFKPVILTRSFSKPKDKEESKNRANKYSNRRKEEEQYSDNLNINKISGESPISSPRGSKFNKPEKTPDPSRKLNSNQSIQKEIERLRKARELKQKKKLAKESPHGKNQIIDSDSKMISPSKSSASKPRNQCIFQNIDLINHLPPENKLDCILKDDTELEGGFVHILPEKSENIGEYLDGARKEFGSCSPRGNERKEQIEIISKNELITIDEVVESNESSKTKPDLEENKEHAHDSSMQDKEFALETFIVDHSIPEEAAEKLRSILRLA